MSRKIEVVPYNINWQTLYGTEAQKITNALGSEVFGIHHIGSTAIPGIMAKPIIDIMVVIHNITVISDYINTMIDLGYEPLGENGIPGRQFFIKDTEGIRTQHIHIYQVGHKEIQRHLQFRDYLRTHPEDALVYSQLKEELSKTYRNDPQGYTNGKDEFVEKIDKRANKWKGR